MAIEQEFRDPSDQEVELIRKLLAADFPGKTEVMKQLQSCRVRRIDSEGSLEIRPSAAAGPAVITKRIPVEANAPDDDGVDVNVLLHVVDGFVTELEIYKNDGTPIRRMPRADDLNVTVLPA